jgi:HSP20 family protein
MNIVRWDPFREMVSLRDAVDKVWDHNFPRSWISPELGGIVTPSIDMYETDTELTVKAVMPGVKAEDLDINVTGDSLTIKGESKVEEEKKEKDYYYRECRYGTFTRSLNLPSGLKTDKVDATLDGGVLTLSIPKAESAKPKTIKVKAKQISEGKAEAKKES